MFVFGGLLLGLLMLLGYVNVTKEQINSCNEKLKKNEENQTLQTETVNKSQNVNLDLMMERLEKLNKIKEMGGLSDEEYNDLRKRILNQ